MDPTIAAAWVGAATGVVSLVWQVVRWWLERARVVVRSWWERDDRLGSIFVVEVHNASTKAAVELVAVGAELETEPDPLHSWWILDSEPFKVQDSLGGSDRVPITLLAQHKATYRFRPSLVELSRVPFVPIVRLATGEVVRGKRAPARPDRDMARDPGIGLATPRGFRGLVLRCVRRATRRADLPTG